MGQLSLLVACLNAPAAPVASGNIGRLAAASATQPYEQIGLRPRSSITAVAHASQNAGNYAHLHAPAARRAYAR